jgi:chromosome partitioning protein
MVKIIAIANQKGGVGKTTTAINLGASLATMEKKTLLVDLDSQANATTGLGKKKEEVKSCIYDLIIQDREEKDAIPVSEVICGTDLEYLSLLPSTTGLAGAEIELFKMLGREYRVKNILEPLRSDYDFILIDCPPTINILMINGLVAADSVMLPIQCEYYALEGLAELLNTVRLIQKSLNRDLEIQGALLTMYDSRLNLSKQVAEDVKDFFSDKVFQTIIHRNVRLSEAPSHGEPILLYDIQSQGAKDYFNLANELAARVEKV